MRQAALYDDGIRRGHIGGERGHHGTIVSGSLRSQRFHATAGRYLGRPARNRPLSPAEGEGTLRRTLLEYRPCGTRGRHGGFSRVGRTDRLLRRCGQGRLVPHPLDARERLRNLNSLCRFRRGNLVRRGGAYRCFWAGRSTGYFSDEKRSGRTRRLPYQPANCVGAEAIATAGATPWGGGALRGTFRRRVRLLSGTYTPGDSLDR